MSRSRLQDFQAFHPPTSSFTSGAKVKGVFSRTPSKVLVVSCGSDSAFEPSLNQSRWQGSAGLALVMEGATSGAESAINSNHPAGAGSWPDSSAFY